METKNQKEYKRKKVRNNGVEIGSITIYPKQIKRILIFGASIFMSVTAFFIGRATKDRPIYRVVPNTLTESYFEEPTYSGIPYVVSYGDTLSRIVYSYEDDTNKAMEDIRLIEEYNGIKRNEIYSGQTILLVGVPADKLEEFGYTDNYNYFEPSVEVDLRLDFLKKVVERISSDTEHDKRFDMAVEQAEREYIEYKNEYLPGDEYKLDFIINILRDLSEEARGYGYSFENNLKALPLSEADYYDTYKGL